MLIHHFQGPLADQVLWVDRARLFRRHGRLCYEARDPRDARGFVLYAQAKSLGHGVGCPERWQTIDAEGRWTHDEARYAFKYVQKPIKNSDLDWARYGAEPPPD